MMVRTLFTLLLLLTFKVDAATWNISYARLYLEDDLRTKYPLAVLALALDQTGVRYKITPTKKVTLQGRAIKQLKANREVSIVWSMTDKVREEELLPVRIPIYKGLIGWRIFLSKEDYLLNFSEVKTLEELRRYTPVQGHDWPDTKILQANGFEVVTSSDYGNLFEIVERDRANFFPRSIVEIWAEVGNTRLNRELSVEPQLAIRYPTATYFFFNKKNKVLANLVRTGLERAIANGKFDELFMEVHSDYLEQANIENRILFDLENPILPPATPLDRKELWYQVDKDKVEEAELDGEE